MIHRFFSTIAGSLALALALPLSQPVLANEYAVASIKYQNKGAYEAFLNVQGDDYRWNGDHFECLGANTTGSGIKSGKSRTIQLDNSDGGFRDDCGFKKGSEVWGAVYIDRGDNFGPTAKRRSCRKDGTKFFYNKDGGQVVVKTGGTTENKNRCKIVSRGGVRWDEAIHGVHVNIAH